MKTRVSSDEIRKRLEMRILQVGSPSYRDMARRMTYAHQRIQAYVSGSSETIPADFLAQFVQAYPTDLVWLLLGIGTPEVSASVPAAERALGEIEGILRRYHQQVSPA